MPFSERVDRALVLAAQLHRDQVRKGNGSTVPYVSHLWSVAGLVAEQNGSEDEVIAALLHDAAEDQGGQAAVDHIRREFGDLVADVVLECTDTLESPKPPWKERKDNYLTHLERASESALRVSLADKIHNSRALLMEVREKGVAAFDIFKGGKDGTLWYYASLVEIYRRCTPGPWADELARTVEAITQTVERDVIGRFLHEVVNDQSAAAKTLQEHPWLRAAKWRLGESLVHFLAIEDYQGGVKWLLENGLAADRVNELGDTALFDVLKLGNYEMASLLIAYGANPFVVSPTHGTLIEYAKLADDKQLVEFLNSINPSKST